VAKWKNAWQMGRSNALCDAKSSLRRSPLLPYARNYLSGSLVSDARFLTALFLQVPLVRVGGLDRSFIRETLIRHAFISPTLSCYLFT